MKERRKFFTTANNRILRLQTFYPLVARAELPEDAMPLEFMQDRRLDFVDYSKLKPFTVSISRSDIFPLFRTSSKNFAATRILSMVRIECRKFPRATWFVRNGEETRRKRVPRGY